MSGAANQSPRGPFNRRAGAANPVSDAGRANPAKERQDWHLSRFGDRDRLAISIYS